MGNFDPMKAISNLISKILQIIADTTVKIFQPILKGVSSIIGVFSAPLVPIFNGFISTFVVGVVNSFLHTIFPRDFSKTSGWEWFCGVASNTFFVGVYFIFLFGYFFIMRFAGTLLTFLTFPMLLTVFILPFLPIVDFIFICIKNKNTEGKKSANIIIGFINQIIYDLKAVKNFFYKNIVNILSKFIIIFLYQIFLFGYDIFSSLPIVADQLFKFGIVGQIIISVIIYYPVWWFLYSLYVNRNTVNQNNDIDFANTNFKDILQNLNKDLDIRISYLIFPGLSNIKLLCEKTLSNLNLLNLENLENAFLDYAKSSELSVLIASNSYFIAIEVQTFCTNKQTVLSQLKNAINTAPRFDFLTQKILTAIDSVINTFWFAWDWIKRKTNEIIEILKAK